MEKNVATQADSSELKRKTDFAMKPTKLFLSLLLVTGSVRLAQAIGPDYQILPTSLQSSTTASSVVDFLTSSTSTTDDGTGTIINKYSSNGMDYAQILTADHVAGVGGYTDWVGLQVNNDKQPTAGGATPNLFQEQLLGAQPAGGYSLGIGGPNPAMNFEDIDIVQITLGAATNAYVSSLFGGIAVMHISSPAINQLATLGTNSLAYTFTEYGYGYAGKPIVQGTTPGYAPYDRPFNLRFQNNTLTGITTNYTQPGNKVPAGSQNSGAYSEPLVQWKKIAPSTQFQGTSLAGDSGGPYVYLNSQSLSITNYSGAAVRGSIYTDYQFAVHVLGTATGTNWTTFNYNSTNNSTTGKAKLNGDLNEGVFIDQANYNWIMSIVPEPSPAAIFATGVSVLFFARRRRSC